MENLEFIIANLELRMAKATDFYNERLNVLNNIEPKRYREKM